MLAALFPDMKKYSPKEEVLKSIETVTLADIENFCNYIKNNAMAKAIFTAPIEKNPDIAQTVLNKLSYGIGNFQQYRVDTFKNFKPVEQKQNFDKSRTQKSG